MITGMGERLRELRQKRNLTQTAVARMLGVTRATISGYENNISQPPADILMKLASLYRCTTDYILGINGGWDVLLKASSSKQRDKIIQIISLVEED